MPYGSDTSAAPRIVDEGAKRLEEFWTILASSPFGPTTWGHTYRIITTQQYRLTCLTQSAATAAAGVTMDTYSHETRTAQRISPDGQFQLRVTRDSWTAYTTDTIAADT